MITPNKVVSLEASAISRLPVLLGEGPSPIALPALWDRVHSSFESLDQFLLSLDILYVLGRIDVDRDRGVVVYAD